MSLGVLKVGALTLNENYKIADATNAQSGVRTVNVSGIETYPGRTLAQIKALADDLTSMFGKTVPITFSHKTDRSGYYTIDDVNTTATHWEGEATGFTWSLGLTRIGPDNAVDIESRMVHVVRANNFSQTGERWHAPPIGHNTYYVGASTPATVVRLTDAGPITVYRSIPAVNPRYGCPVGSSLVGRVRLLSGGIERAGQGIKMDSGDWELNNGLVRVRPHSGGLFTTLAIAFWDGSTWAERDWDIRIAGDSLRPGVDWVSATVLRCDPEMVAIRILATQPSNAQRVLVDLVLRRGSRFVEGYIQRTVSGDITVCLDVAEPYTSGTGYVVATSDIGTGVRVAAGSAKTFTAAANLGVFLTPATAMDFWIGAEVLAPDLGGAPDLGAETGTTTGWTSTVATISSSTDQAKFGSRSWKVVATGAAGFPAISAVTPSVSIPGQQYRISAWLYAPVALGGNAFIDIQWLNAGSGYISEFLSPVAVPAGVWKYWEATATAPALAVKAVRVAGIQVNPTPAGTVLHVENLTLRPLVDSGDAVAVLQSQYIAAASEATMVVAR